MKIFINGHFYEKSEAKISVYDHGLLYGDGVFEGIRFYKGKIFKLQQHVKRLYKSARAILLEIPMNQEEMAVNIQDTVERNQKENGYIRVVVTRGNGSLGIDPDKCEKPNIIIIVDILTMYPDDYYENGIEIITSSTLRLSPAAFDPRIKSLNYLNNILAKLEAKKAGVLECVMLNSQGYVVECTGDNLFMVRDGELLTPSAFLGALDGITKETIIEIAGKTSIPVKEAMLTKYDLYNADEIFLSGTGAELIPVIKIDGRIISNGNPGNIYRQILRQFRETVNSL